MSIVTIRGQLASGATEIGKLVADKLHIDYVDREIIAQVAERVHWPERDIAAKEMPTGSLIGRIAEALGQGYAAGGYYPGAYVTAWEIPLNDTQYLAGLESVIKELASCQSIVIRGRGSQFILKDYPGVFHALIVAPLEVRLKRVMDSLKVNKEAAKKEIERSDSRRREFTKRYFQAELEDPVYYDIVINTQHFSYEAATSIIVNALSFKA